jgi:DNA adenine methylase
MLGVILPLLSPHVLYCEPFTGGAAVFFAKPPSTIEVLNDLNTELVNFYEVLKRDFDALAAEAQTSLYSRELHRRARTVYSNPDMFDRIKRAWAVWYLAASSFGSNLNGVFGIDATSRRAWAFNRKRKEFTFSLSERLKNTRVESYDAVKVIQDNDAADSLFYIDPPYVGADQGHYAGYTQTQFDALLQTLAGIKGRFLLSSYRNAELEKYTEKNRWYIIEIVMNNTTSSSVNGCYSAKIEVLTANYHICKNNQPELFQNNSG